MNYISSERCSSFSNQSSTQFSVISKRRIRVQTQISLSVGRLLSNSRTQQSKTAKNFVLVEKFHIKHILSRVHYNGWQNRARKHSHTSRHTRSEEE